MTKSNAVYFFGSNVRLADAMRVSRQAITNWPDELTNDLELKVIGAAVRSGRWGCDGYQQYSDDIAQQNAA